MGKFKKLDLQTDSPFWRDSVRYTGQFGDNEVMLLRRWPKSYYVNVSGPSPMPIPGNPHCTPGPELNHEQQYIFSESFQAETDEEAIQRIPELLLNWCERNAQYWAALCGQLKPQLLS